MIGSQIPETSSFMAEYRFVESGIFISKILRNFVIPNYLLYTALFFKSFIKIKAKMTPYSV